MVKVPPVFGNVLTLTGKRPGVYDATVMSLLRSLPVTLMVAVGCWFCSQVKLTDVGLTVSVGVLVEGLEPVATHPQ